MKKDDRLELEVEELEHRGKPGCGSSSTSPLCTCPLPVQK